MQNRWTNAIAKSVGFVCSPGCYRGRYRSSFGQPAIDVAGTNSTSLGLSIQRRLRDSPALAHCAEKAAGFVHRRAATPTVSCCRNPEGFHQGERMEVVGWGFYLYFTPPHRACGGREAGIPTYFNCVLLRYFGTSLGV